MHGEVTISGAKNAVLPILAATLLTPEPCVIRRVPNLSDVKFMGQILTWLGAQVRVEGDTIRVQARKIKGAGDYDLIVTGTPQTRGLLGHYIMGDLTRSILNGANCPVLVARAGKPKAARTLWKAIKGLFSAR